MSSGYLVGRTVLSCIKTSLLAPQVNSSSLNYKTVRCLSVTSSRKMKLLQFTSGSPLEIRAGYLDGDTVVDINKADPSLPSTVLEILRQDVLERVKNLPQSKPASIPLSSVKLMAPVLGMDKVLCIGLNYIDHCAEQNLEKPKVPMIFNKFPSTVVGPNEPVRLRTDVTNKVDWEVELVVVIGKKASRVKAADAYSVVAGYTIAQDISARDWQKERNMGQFLLGKAMDTFCPLGPWIVSRDEVPDPQTLAISCRVNGVSKQTSNTNQLLHKIPDVIERLTSVMTLLPGDILLTGTPGGVGMYRSPPEYLKPGDVIDNEIESIGVLTVHVGEF